MRHLSCVAVLKINKKNAKYPNTLCRNSHSGGITNYSWKDGSFLFFFVFCFSSELAPSFRFAQRLFFIFFTCLQWLQVTNSAFHCHLPISWVVQMVLWQLYISSVAWSLIARLQDNFLINWWSLLSWGRRCTDGTLIIVICWGIILTSCRLTGLGLSAINWETYFNTQHADLVA